MEIVKVVLTLLICRSVATQYPYGRIVEPSVLTEGGDYTVSCNSDLAGVPGKGQNQGLISMSIGWTNEIDELETFVRYVAITKVKYYHSENNIFALNMRLWTYKLRGPDKLNSHGWPERDALNITLSATNAKLQETGIFCCNASYLDINDDIRITSRCRKIRVTHNSIVSRPEARVDGAFTVACESNLAGVPAQTYGLYYLAILFVYQGEEKLYARLGLGSYPLKVTRPPSPLRNWTFNFYGVETLDAHGRLERDKAKTELLIRDTKYSDSGMYCCQATYFTLYTDDEQDVKRCQNITVTHREIVEPKAVSVGQPFTVFCDADLADVPDLIYGVQQFALMWSSGKENPTRRAHMNSRVQQSFLYQTPSHWSVSFKGAETVNPAQLYERNQAKITLTVSAAQTSDAGMYCCDVIYIAIIGDARYYWTEREPQIRKCQNLKVGQNMEFSTNGKSCMDISAGLFVGLLTLILSEI